MQLFVKMMMGCAAAWTFACAAAEQPESWAHSGTPVTGSACVKATDLREVLLALKQQLKLPDAPPGRRRSARTPGTARLIFLPDGTVGVECAKGMYPTVDYKVAAYTPAEDGEAYGGNQDGKDNEDNEDNQDNQDNQDEDKPGAAAGSDPGEASRVQAVEVCARKIVMACLPMPKPVPKRKARQAARRRY